MYSTQCYLLEHTKIRNRIVKTEVLRFSTPEERHRYTKQAAHGTVQSVGSTNRLVIRAKTYAKLGYEWPICVYGELDASTKKEQSISTRKF